MHRLDYYFSQIVTDAELDLGFTYCEEADHAQQVDALFDGVFSGLNVSEETIEQAAVDLGVNLSVGVAYDQAGQRMEVLAPEFVVVSVDSNVPPVSTAVLTPGNEKWLSLYIEFTRVETDPRIDGNSNTVYFDRAESYTLSIVQGSEAAPPAARPALDDTKILLADIKLIFGTDIIETANISLSRKQYQFNKTDGDPVLAHGTVREALGAIADRIAAITAGTAVTATHVAYAGGGTWADTSTNPAVTVEAQLDKIITDLSSTSDGAGGCGADKIGAEAITASPTSLTGGTLESQISALLSAVNARGVLASTNTWAAKGTFSNQIEVTQTTPSAVTPLVNLLQDDATDHYQLLERNYVKNGGTTYPSVRRYRTRDHYYVTHNCYWVVADSKWAADDNALPAWMVRTGLLGGEDRYWKHTTTSAWSSWDSNAIQSSRGFKYIAFTLAADTVDDTTADGDFHVIHRSVPSSTDFQVVIPAVAEYSMIKVHASLGCRNTTASTGIKAQAKVQVYTDQDAVWRDISGSLAWDWYDASTAAASSAFALQGVYQLPTTAGGVHENVTVQVVACGTDGAIVWHPEMSLIVEALKIS